MPSAPDVNVTAIQEHHRQSLLPSGERWLASQPQYSAKGTKRPVTACDFCNSHRTCECTICLDMDRHHSNPNLCEDCQRWDDLNHVLFCEHSQYVRLDPDIFGVKSRSRQKYRGAAPCDQDLEDLTFYPISHFSQRRRCMICREVWDAVQPHLDPEAYTTVATWRPFAQNQVYPLSGHQGIGPMEERCILPICLSIHSETQADITYKPLALPLVLHYRRYGFSLELVTRWDRRHIDMARVKSWLTLCQDHHGKRCNTILVKPTLPEGFRLIDTFSMCLSEHSSATPFAALSYLWASQSASQRKTIQLERGNQAELERKNGLDPSQLPDVIADAIQLCVDMGQRYLWVDRLCIIQDDSGSKHAQITAMDRIYGMALFTIVAATDGIPGLPGVSTRPRPTSPEISSWRLGLRRRREVIQPRMLNPVSYRDIDRSSWNTRGWTFQERILSRRHLIVCGEHIFLSCFYTTEQDDLLDLSCRFDRHAESFEKGLQLWSNIPFRYRGAEGDSILQRYREVVRNYTSRTLSYASDVLRAFAGIESVLAAQLKTNFVQGLPERYFLNTLYWRPNGPSVLRDRSLIFRSWSWAAWDGHASYDDHRCSRFISSGNMVRFHYSDPLLGVRPVTETTTWVDHEDLTEFDDETRLWLYTYKIQRPTVGLALRGDAEDHLRIWRQCPHNPWNAHHHRDLSEPARALANTIPACLAFNTTSAKLNLVEQPPQRLRDHGTRQVVGFDIVTCAHEVIGHTQPLDSEWTSRNIVDGKEYHVIVLEASRREPDTVEPYWDAGRQRYVSPPNNWGFNVMITEREGLLSRRVTFGTISIEGWTMIMPQWETVFLV